MAEGFPVLSMQVYWCWRPAGLPLDRSIVFHRDTIEEHVRTGCPHLSGPSSSGKQMNHKDIFNGCDNHIPSTPMHLPIKPSRAEIFLLRTQKY